MITATILLMDAAALSLAVLPALVPARAAGAAAFHINAAVRRPLVVVVQWNRALLTPTVRTIAGIHALM